jgi:uncharacterized protein
VITATADSNIYVSALQFGGVPLQFLNTARSATFRLAISEVILAEIRGVLRDKFRWSEEMLDEGISDLRDFTQPVTPMQRLHVIAEDPDDDRVIECAVASDSQYIVSGDKHLLRLIQYQSIRVLRVSEFLTLIPKPVL